MFNSSQEGKALGSVIGIGEHGRKGENQYT